MNSYYAQPYDMTAVGFGFEDAEDYADKVKACRNAYGQPVEEFELQYVGDDALEARLFEALGVHQGNIGAYLDALPDWDDGERVKLIIAVGEVGYPFTIGDDTADDVEVDLYPDATLRELAEQFVDEGLFGEIPSALEHYIDYDAIARDLRHDYTEIGIAGERYVYRCS